MYPVYRLMKVFKQGILKGEEGVRGDVVPGPQLNTQGYTGALALFIVIAIAGAAFGVVYGVAFDRNQDGMLGLESVGPGGIRIGDVIQTVQFDISVSDIATTQKVGRGYITSEAPEGYMYLTVLWHYTGTAVEPAKGFPLPAIQLLDRKGSVVHADFIASGSYAAQMNIFPEVFRELIPGETVDNAHVFVVLRERYAEGGWRLYLRADRDIHLALN